MNEAAERLLRRVHESHALQVSEGWGNCKLEPCIDVWRALAAERHATVERVFAELMPLIRMKDQPLALRILDAEAQS